MKISPRAIVGVLISMVLSGCGPQHIFSPQVLEGVDQNFDFTAWRMVPNAKAGKKVQLGGRILQAPQRDGLVTMVLTQLPIVEHPAYGPTDTERGRGEFLVYFNGKVPMNHLQPGNRVIVIGTTSCSRAPAILAVMPERLMAATAGVPGCGWIARPMPLTPSMTPS